MDENSEAVLELLKCPGNEICADCGFENVEYASYNIGIFVCGRCSEVHRKLGTGVSQVKHVRMDRWEESQVLRITEVGNTAAKAEYEACLPPAYRLPTHSDTQALLEEWIVGKYVRGEFRREKGGVKNHQLEDFIMKRGKEDSKYHPRKFVLSLEHDDIRYYVHQTKEAKGVMKLSDVSLSLAPEKMEKACSLQMSYSSGRSTRHLYLYHEDPRTLILWYQTIRSCQIQLLQTKYPHASPSELVSTLNEDFKEGWLWKTGPRPTHVFRKRWFMLDRRKLMYHEEPLSAWPKGEILLGREGYSVRLGIPSSAKDQGYSFTLRTPQRWYYLSAESEAIRNFWMSALNQAITSPISEYSSYFTMIKSDR